MQKKWGGGNIFEPLIKLFLKRASIFQLFSPQTHMYPLQGTHPMLRVTKTAKEFPSSKLDSYSGMAACALAVNYIVDCYDAGDYTVMGYYDGP